jgi:transposase
MTLRPASLPAVPEATVAAVQAAVRKGNRSVALRTEFGARDDDQRFADVSPPSGRAMDVAPWRLALVVVMPYRAGLTDRQAAAAVRRGMAWTSALRLDMSDPGFDFTLVPDFRGRVRTYEAGHRVLETFLAACNARSWITARGAQRTGSTHVLAAIRTRPRVACVLETRHHALNQRSDVAPAWVQPQGPVDWSPREGLRSDQTRLPTDASPREALARQSGADGDQLLDWGRTADTALGLRERPALEAWRRSWRPQ